MLWQHQSVGEPFDVFQHHFCAVLEHHYSDHSWCVGTNEAGWCKYKNNNENKAIAKRENWFHDKVVYVDQYKKVLLFGSILPLRKFSFNSITCINLRRMSH